MQYGIEKSEEVIQNFKELYLKISNFDEEDRLMRINYRRKTYNALDDEEDDEVEFEENYLN